MTAYTVIEYQVIVSKPGCPDIDVHNLTLHNANPRPVRAPDSGGPTGAEADTVRAAGWEPGKWQGIQTEAQLKAQLKAQMKCN